MDKKATVTINGNTFDLPIKYGPYGQQVIDINQLAKQNIFTFDPGFTATSSTESKITFINGSKGVLLYRGYPIEQLAEQADYMEVCYLLFYGELPDHQQKQEYIKKIKSHALLDEQILKLVSGFRRTAHPMAIAIGAVSALAGLYHDQTNIYDPTNRELTAIRIVAKIATIAAICYRYNRGLPFMYPEDKYDYATNFLHMMFGTPTKQIDINPVFADAMDKIFILHADHEQNASTSTVRLAGSTGANPYACIASGIAALWGPAHGGANEAVIKMLENIGNSNNIPEYLTKAKDKNDPFRLMGFGHRVYKNYDPRAKVMRKTCHDVLAAMNKTNDPLFKMALELEQIALEDQYFIDRKLYPNVDFYSGIILKVLGIPANMFTLIFTLSRTIGWISHWNEMITDPNLKIGRPRQLYTGSEQKNYNNN